MPKSATDTMQDIVFAAVVDAIVALRDASKGVPNLVLRDLAAIHANTAFADLPEPIKASVATSVRGAFTKLQKEGYAVADAAIARQHAPRPPRPDTRGPARGPRRPPPKR